MTWLESQAKKWIEQGKIRIPVEGHSNVGWSQSGILQANGSTSVAVQLQVDFTGQIQTHTIQFDGFNDDLDVGALPATTAITEAEILWSVKGTTIRRLISVLDGQSISGMAQSVTVNMRDVTINGNGSDYRVGMTVVPGVRANIQQPPSLRISGENSAAPGVVIPFGTGLAAGDFATWTIPPNVGAVSAMIGVGTRNGGGGPQSLLDSDLAIQYIASNTAVLKRLDVRSGNLWIPLFSGTRTIKAFNNSPTKIIDVSCTIGIDG